MTKRAIITKIPYPYKYAVHLQLAHAFSLLPICYQSGEWFDIRKYCECELNHMVFIHYFLLARLWSRVANIVYSQDGLYVAQTWLWCDMHASPRVTSLHNGKKSPLTRANTIWFECPSNRVHCASFIHSPKNEWTIVSIHVRVKVTNCHESFIFLLSLSTRPIYP